MHKTKASTPCLGICSTTYGDDVCKGCKRFVHEVIGWNKYETSEKESINKSFKKLEKLFNNEIVTLVWKFEKFYPAEDYHQDYYEKNFIRYLMYKKGCKREETLKRIWN